MTVPRNQLQPSDLVFLAQNPANPPTIHQVGVYIGRGRMVHAPHTGDVGRVSPIRRRPIPRRGVSRRHPPGTPHHLAPAHQHGGRRMEMMASAELDELPRQHHHYDRHLRVRDLP